MVELWAQYHLVASQEYGPVPVSSGGQPVATLPATTVSFSHFMVGLGIGVRLGRMGSGAPAELPSDRQRYGVTSGIPAPHAGGPRGYPASGTSIARKVSASTP
jgi:hypothetical protein